MNLQRARQQLLDWYRANKRDLPWRLNRDPYRIWISETMLQQTTTTAVIPFFERFMAKFPTLVALAAAPESAVVAAWAGLGYYSRARNLHKAARILVERPEFPARHLDLIRLPGLGPYTARAVASLAFGEECGVVDGNVIRVFARLYDRDWDWWKPEIRREIQNLADAWTKGAPSSEVNQGLMELGRTICTPKSPACPLCPLRQNCMALRHQSIPERPRSRPKRAKEIWWWKAHVCIRGGQLRLVRNRDLPFLKGQWLLPGEGRVVPRAPARFDYRHSITHYDIFVTLKAKPPKLGPSESLWAPLEEIEHHVPSSLVHKALAISCSPRTRLRQREKEGIQNRRRDQRARRRNPR